jgi:TonB family protein
MVMGTPIHQEEFIMRKLLVASLLLSPVLCVASAVAATSKTDASDAQVRQVSTGITTPAVLDSASIHIPGASLGRTESNGAKVVLALNVDAKGNAQNVRVVQSANPELDARVVTAVRRSSFHPATVDNHAVPVKVDLVVSVQR